MVVDITVGDSEPSSYEDRFVLIAAMTAEEARAKGEEEAERYAQRYLNTDGETVTWIVRGISDIYALMDKELTDGTELYSCFVDREWADLLMAKGESPLQAWERENPGKDSGQATVAEVTEAWDRTHDESRHRSFPGTGPDD
jgi:hypothetical protein